MASTTRVRPVCTECKTSTNLPEAPWYALDKSIMCIGCMWVHASRQNWEAKVESESKSECAKCKQKDAPCRFDAAMIVRLCHNCHKTEYIKEIGDHSAHVVPDTKKGKDFIIVSIHRRDIERSLQERAAIVDV